MVIFHSYVSLPEGIPPKYGQKCGTYMVPPWYSDPGDLPLIYDWIISDVQSDVQSDFHGVLESITPSNQVLPLMGSIESSQHLEDSAAGHMLRMLRMLCSDLLRLKISTDHLCDIGLFLHPNPQKTIKTQVKIDMCQILKSKIAILRILAPPKKKSHPGVAFCRAAR